MSIINNIKQTCFENTIKDDVDDFKQMFMVCISEIQRKFNIDEGGLKLDCFGGSIRLENLLKLSGFIFLKLNVDEGGNIMYTFISAIRGSLNFRYMTELKQLWFVECDLSKSEIQSINSQLKAVIKELGND